MNDCAKTEADQLEQIDWLALLQLAVDRAARGLETVASIPKRKEFNKEAAQSTRVRGFCLTNLMCGVPASI